ncbi:hypothetical protein Bbelb_140180 [Branchiostoma belcheri]|nr:hypothetical protein Bbelb_140180 [Branchiostoma belcheri]
MELTDTESQSLLSDPRLHPVHDQQILLQGNGASQLHSLQAPFSQLLTTQDPSPVSYDTVPQPLPLQDTVPQPLPLQDTVPQPLPLQDTVPHPRPLQDTVPQPLPLQDTAPHSRPLQDTAPHSRPLQDTVPHPRPLQDTVPHPRPLQDTAPHPRPLQDTAPHPRPLQDTAPQLHTLMCELCGKTFPTQKYLARHKRWHDGKYKCTHCDGTFHDNASRDMHIKFIHNGQLLKCSQCDKKFKSAGGLRKHMSLHVAKLHKCKTEGCDSQFTSVAALYYHQEKHHAKNSSSFECGDCYKTFPSTSKLEKHVISHDNIRPFTCESCHATLKRKNDLTRHILTHTSASCDICGGKYRGTHQLKRHVKNIH